MNKPGAETPLVTDLLVTSCSSWGVLGASLLLRAGREGPLCFWTSSPGKPEAEEFCPGLQSSPGRGQQGLAAGTGSRELSLHVAFYEQPELLTVTPFPGS